MNGKIEPADTVAYIDNMRYQTKKARLLAIIDTENRGNQYLFRTAKGRYFVQTDTSVPQGGKHLYFSEIRACNLGEAVAVYEKRAKEQIVPWNEAFPDGIQDA